MEGRSGNKVAKRTVNGNDVEYTEEGLLSGVSFCSFVVTSGLMRLVHLVSSSNVVSLGASREWAQPPVE